MWGSLATQDGASSAPRRSRGADDLIPHIRALTESLRNCSAAELHAEMAHLRSEFSMTSDPPVPEHLVAGIALATEALRRGHGVDLYDVQLMAVIHLAQGRIAQMQTGEGKTFVAIVTSAYQALKGRGVHVMTPNSYLARRDCELARSVLGHLNMTVGLTPDQGEDRVKKRAYDCDVTYGTGHEFGFDYLRDQLTLRREQAATLGSRLLRDLHVSGACERGTLQRGLIHAVVDEADSVLVDDAASPLVLSMSAGQTAPDVEAHLAANAVADILEQDVHYRHDASAGSIRLLQAGLNRCYEDDVAVPVCVLLRPWTDYVEQALRARLIFRRNVHYVVEQGEVRIVDETTGRIFEDRSWQEGLHQAIEAREGLTVTAEKESLAQITRQRFFRLYENLCGMTGTALGCEAEFQLVYRSTVAEIPLRRPSSRVVLRARFFDSHPNKHRAIAESVAEAHRRGQPILVGTQSITESEVLADLFSGMSLSVQLLNGLQTEEEAKIVAAAGRVRAITIATNLAGRGTDIPVAADALKLGGLHVIVAECQLSARMDRQLVGRGARQGDPGTTQMFVSADDSLLIRFGEWLGRAIRRDADENGESHINYSNALRRLQRRAEKQQFHARAELLRKDNARDRLFGGLN